MSSGSGFRVHGLGWGLGFWGSGLFPAMENQKIDNEMEAGITETHGDYGFHKWETPNSVYPCVKVQFFLVSIWGPYSWNARSERKLYCLGVLSRAFYGRGA